MTTNQVHRFLDEYQALCEKYELHLEVDLDGLIINDCHRSWLTEEIEDLKKYACQNLEEEKEEDNDA